MKVVVRLYTPSDWSGCLIAWRLMSPYCHATIEIDDVVYSATVPRIVALSPYNVDVAQPPRGGISFNLSLTDEQAQKARDYCTSMVGSEYDLLSILGWALRIPSLQENRRAYCFELVYDALAAAGIFPTSKRLVTAEQLTIDMMSAGIIPDHSIPTAMAMRAPTQHNPITVKAP